MDRWCKETRCYISIALILVGLFPVIAYPVVQTESVAKPCDRTNVVAYKGLAYFCSEHKYLGKEVFVSDGGEFSSQILVDLDPGPGDSSPLGFFEFKGFLFFVAETTPTGWALWKFDGHDNGVSLVRSLPDLDGTAIYYSFLVAAETQDSLYFQIGRNLFKTDGTPLGTVPINVPITQGLISSGTFLAATSYFVKDDELYLMTDTILYRVNTNGSSTQIVQLPSSRSDTPFIYKDLTLSGKFLIRVTVGSFDVEYRRELWLSDGTADGTTLARTDDTEPVGNIGSRLLLVNYSSDLLFSTGNGIDQVNIARNVEYRGNLNLSFGNFVSFIGEYDNGVYPLWITDGTKSGTIELPSIPIQFREKLIGAKGLGTLRNGESFLWVSDITSPSPKKILSVTDGSLNVLAASSKGVFLTKSIGGVEQELWITDGTSEGTRRVSQLDGSIPHSRGVWIEGQRIFFKLYESNSLWHSDGTENGTYELKYRFNDGLPPQLEPQNDFILVPILDLILE